MNLLEVKNLTKFYNTPGGSRLQVLDNISFSLTDEDKGKIISIIAPIGAGKSTLLRIICGLDSPDEGSVSLLNNQYNTAAGSIIYLPENPVSFPWLSVKGNFELALKLNPSKQQYSLDDIITITGLRGYEDHFPDNRSTGFRFRISIGRALAVNPDLILIDDSFKQMDHLTRKEIYELLRKVTENTQKTIILATTNISEAAYLSDRVLFMKKYPGRIFYDMQIADDKVRNSIHLNSVREEIENIYKQENLTDTLQIII